MVELDELFEAEEDTEYEEDVVEYIRLLTKENPLLLINNEEGWDG